LYDPENKSDFNAKSLSLYKSSNSSSVNPSTSVVPYLMIFSIVVGRVSSIYPVIILFYTGLVEILLKALSTVIVGGILGLLVKSL
jgi:hypothetical protein